MSRSGWLVVVVALALVAAGGAAVAADAAPPPPVAADRIAKARALSDEGLFYFKLGEWDHAIELFQASYAVVARAELLFDIAQAHRKRGRCDAALDMYRRYLAAQPDARNRQSVLDRITEMEQCLRVPAASSPLAPPLPPATPPAAPPPAAPPPRAAVGTSGLTLALAATPARAAPGAPWRTAGWTMGAAGALALVAGGYSSLRARRDNSEINNLFVNGGAWTAHDNDVVADGRRFQTLSGVFYVGGAVAVGAGVAFYLVGAAKRPPRDAASLTVAWSGDRGGGALAVTCRY
jgi:tetratricopeptide (TPR) repeat protein